MLTSRRPLRIAVLCSGRAPGLAHLLRDADRGHTFEVVCAITSEDAFDEQPAAEEQGVSTAVHSIRRFYARRRAGVYRDFHTRFEYDKGTGELLEPYAPDLVLLAGYLYLVTPLLLAAYPRRMLNLHLSDLALRKRGGQPRFPGLRAVRDALTAGQPETFATIHLVDEAPESGPPIVRSWPFPAAPLVRDARAWSARHMLNAYAAAHQEWMIRTAAGPMWSAVIQLLTSGRVDLDELGARNPADVAPWDVDLSGTLTAPPDGSSVGMAMLVSGVGTRGGHW